MCQFWVVDTYTFLKLNYAVTYFRQIVFLVMVVQIEFTPRLNNFLFEFTH